MATRQLPDAELLRKLLRYEPETGKLFWLPRPVEMFEGGKYPAERLANFWNKKNAGKEAFTTVSQGYHTGAVFRITHVAHRLIWKMMTDCEPEQVDHINGDRSDNRWCNLREATSSQNACNRRLTRSNKSGFKGVSWDRKSEKWRAQIERHGKKVCLGWFSCPQRAHDAYLQASVEMHGEFRRSA